MSLYREMLIESALYVNTANNIHHIEDIMMMCSSSYNEMGVLRLKRLIIVAIKRMEPTKPVVAQET